MEDFSEGMIQCPFLFEVSTVISGACPKGADKFGELYASLNNLPLILFPADWDKYKKKAGYIRNVEMANNAAALIAFWDGVSPGTKHMINIAKEKKLEIFIHLNHY
jgi:hypothetical protein